MQLLQAEIGMRYVVYNHQPVKGMALLKHDLSPMSLFALIIYQENNRLTAIRCHNHMEIFLRVKSMSVPPKHITREFILEDSFLIDAIFQKSELAKCTAHIMGTTKTEQLGRAIWMMTLDDFCLSLS